jgi:beta-lactam-binding protein with PASTA domain
MKSFFRLILLASALLVVALVSALTAMRFAIHGQEVAVPNLVGKTPAEAFRIAEEGGMLVVIERQFYSPTVPEGKILSQVPDAGVQVRRGWQIRVSQSLGPQRVEIPNVLGQSDRAAEINIRRRGLDVASVAQIEVPGSPSDQVLAQNPPPNASGVSAPKISLLVTTGPQPAAFVMPSFVGQPLGSITPALQDAGMRLGSVTVAEQPPAPDQNTGTAPLANAPPAASSPASIVVAQNPAAGQKVLSGSSVSFEVK